MCEKTCRVIIFAKQEMIDRLNTVIGRITKIEAEFENPVIAGQDREYLSLLNQRDRLEHNLQCAKQAETHRSNNNEAGVSYVASKIKPHDGLVYTFTVTMTQTEAGWWSNYLRRSDVFFTAVINGGTQ